MPARKFDTVNFKSPKAHKKLSELLKRLLAKWNVDSKTQFQLLGLNSYPSICSTQDNLVRTNYLLSIHQSLKLLYPDNDNLCYSWVNRKNKAFDNYTPLEIMVEQGVIGMKKISHYLESIKNC